MLYTEIIEASNFLDLISQDERNDLIKFLSRLSNADACEIVGYFNGFGFRKDESFSAAIKIIKTYYERDTEHILPKLIRKFHTAGLF